MLGLLPPLHLRSERPCLAAAVPSLCLTLTNRPLRSLHGLTTLNSATRASAASAWQGGERGEGAAVSGLALSMAQSAPPMLHLRRSLSQRASVGVRRQSSREPQPPLPLLPGTAQRRRGRPRRPRAAAAARRSGRPPVPPSLTLWQLRWTRRSASLLRLPRPRLLRGCPPETRAGAGPWIGCWVPSRQDPLAPLLVMFTAAAVSSPRQLLLLCQHRLYPQQQRLLLLLVRRGLLSNSCRPPTKKSWSCSLMCSSVPLRRLLWGRLAAHRSLASLTTTSAVRQPIIVTGTPSERGSRGGGKLPRHRQARGTLSRRICRRTRGVQLRGCGCGLTPLLGGVRWIYPRLPCQARCCDPRTMQAPPLRRFSLVPRASGRCRCLCALRSCTPQAGCVGISLSARCKLPRFPAWTATGSSVHRLIASGATAMRSSPSSLMWMRQPGRVAEAGAALSPPVTRR